MRNFDDFDLVKKEYRAAHAEDGVDDAATGSSVLAKNASKLKQHRYLHLGLEDCLLGTSPGKLLPAFVRI